MTHADKRTVTTDALETLGQIHTRQERRDAIHLAVEPVEAGQTLRPGALISVRNGVATNAPRENALGIVDPFLPDIVLKGQRFWFVMMPRMVHSLRHVWTHPAFPSPEVVELPAPETDAVKSAALQLREMAADMDCSVERLMDGARAYLATGEYLRFGNDLDYSWNTAKFWRCYELVTGENLGGEDKGFFFSCSC